MNSQHTNSAPFNGETPNQEVHFFSLVIIDESGSMQPIAPFVLETHNGIVQDIIKDMKEYPLMRQYFNSWTFEGSKIRERIPLMEINDQVIPQLQDFRPGGSTPLYDALGTALTKLEREILSHPEWKKTYVSVSIISDGEENSSRSYSGMEIKRLIERLRLLGWKFEYYGADHDIEAAASQIGIPEAKSWDKTSYGMQGVRTDRSVSNKLFYSMIFPESENGKDSK